MAGDGSDGGEDGPRGTAAERADVSAMTRAPGEGGSSAAETAVAEAAAGLDRDANGGGALEPLLVPGIAVPGAADPIPQARRLLLICAVMAALAVANVAAAGVLAPATLIGSSLSVGLIAALAIPACGTLAAVGKRQSCLRLFVISNCLCAAAFLVTATFTLLITLPLLACACKGAASSGAGTGSGSGNCGRYSVNYNDTALQAQCAHSDALEASYHVGLGLGAAITVAELLAFSVGRALYKNGLFFINVPTAVVVGQRPRAPVAGGWRSAARVLMLQRQQQQQRGRPGGQPGGAEPARLTGSGGALQPQQGGQQGDGQYEQLPDDTVATLLAVASSLGSEGARTFLMPPALRGVNLAAASARGGAPGVARSGAGAAPRGATEVANPLAQLEAPHRAAAPAAGSGSGSGSGSGGPASAAAAATPGSVTPVTASPGGSFRSLAGGHGYGPPAATSAGAAGGGSARDLGTSVERSGTVGLGIDIADEVAPAWR